jgi:hypothetical protein
MGIQAVGVSFYPDLPQLLPLMGRLRYKGMARLRYKGRTQSTYR